MRVLVLTSSYPVAGGIVAGSFIRDLLRGLAALGWEFEVVTPAHPGAPDPAREPKIAVHACSYPGARQLAAQRRGLPESLSAAPWRWLLVPGLAHAMRAAAARRLQLGRFDLVWSHWLFPAGLIGAALARRYRLPHAVTAHGGDVHALERIVPLPAVRAGLARTWNLTRFSAPAPRTARRIEAALPGCGVEIVALPAGAPDRVRGTRAAARGPLQILFMGRFEPIKGPDLLLEACARVPAAVGSVTLAGAGPLEPALRRRAVAPGLTVRFAGVLEGAAKRAALAAADLVALPSRVMPGGRSEGLPHAALEALAAGTALVAPAGGALGDLIAATGAGVTFQAEPRDAALVAALAATLEGLARDRGRLAGLAARAAEAGEAFDPRRTLPEWSAFLEAGVRRSA